MPRPYIRLRETTFDLYVERDLLPGYFKIITTFATWCMLGGYVLSAITFTARDEDLTTARNLIMGIASVLLVVGYIGLVVVAFLGKSLLFLIDCVIYPTLTVSILGLISTLANYALHQKSEASQLYMSIPLVTACVTSVVSATILAIAYRELWKIRKRDERRRWHSQVSHSMAATPDQRSILSFSGSDDEAQRRQLMRLLSDRHESGVNVEEANQTYKLNMPGEATYAHKQQHIPEHKDPVPKHSTFSLGMLIAWRNAEAGTFKDARERRREQIELASIPANHEDMSASDVDSSTQPPKWGWPPATRYA